MIATQGLLAGCVVRETTFMINVLSNKCTSWYNIHDAYIPTCFGTEMTSSGSYYNKGVQTNLPMLLAGWFVLCIVSRSAFVG